MGAIINQHNRKILRPEPTPARCKCRDPSSCPLPGKCTTDKLVYRATVTTATNSETYVGLTAGQFKDRYYKHEGDFRDPERRTATELASHIWDLKDSNTQYNIQWEIVKRANPFSHTSNRCDLCLAEKIEIIYNPLKATLKKRYEVFNHCRHRASLLLVKKKVRKRIPGD